jgi:tape measure domain-containing protein
LWGEVVSTETIDIRISETGSREAAQGIKSVGEAGDKAAASVDKVKGAFEGLKGILASVGLGLSITEVLRLSDTYDGMVNQLKLVTHSSDELAATQKKLFDISQETTTSFEDNVNIYASLSKGAVQYNISAQEVINATQTLAQAMDASGKSGGEAAGAIQQLARGLATGELSGRGFLALFNQVPIVADAIAQSMHVPLSALQDLAVQGKITAKDLINALQSSEVIAAASANKITLVKDAWQNVTNALVLTIGQIEHASGSNKLLVDGLLSLANNMGLVIKSILVITASMTAYGVAAGVARVATMGLMTAFLANPIAATASILVGLITLVMQFGNEIKLTADGSITLLGAVTAVFNVLGQVAQSVGQFFMSMLNGQTLAQAGFLSFANGVYIMRDALIIFLGVQILSYLTSITVGIYGAAAAMVAFATPTRLLIVSVIALTAAVTAAVIGWDNMKLMLNDLAASAKKFASEIGSGVTGEMEKATAAIKAGEAAAGSFGQTAGQSFSGVNAAAQGASSSMAAAGGAAQNMGSQFQQAFGLASSGAMQAQAQVQSFTYDATSKTYKVVYAVRDLVTGLLQVKETAGVTGAELSAAMDKAAASEQRAASSIGEVGAASASAGGGGGGMTMQAFNPNVPADRASWDKWVTWIQGIVDQRNGDSFKGGPVGIGQLWGHDFDPKFTGAFATGGSFKVGGSGGTDTQMVKFMATPGERITVETPAQQAMGYQSSTQSIPYSKRSANMQPDYSPRGSAGGIVVNVEMQVNTPDANSFRQNDTQTALSLQNRLQRVANQLGSNKFA